MMLMTRGSRLAIEALIEPADLGSGKWTTSEALSRGTTGDLPFLQQILYRLVGKGFVRSKKAVAVDISLPVTRRRSH